MASWHSYSYSAIDYIKLADKNSFIIKNSGFVVELRTFRIKDKHYFILSMIQ